MLLLPWRPNHIAHPPPLTLSASVAAGKARWGAEVDGSGMGTAFAATAAGRTRFHGDCRCCRRCRGADDHQCGQRRCWRSRCRCRHVVAPRPPPLPRPQPTPCWLPADGVQQRARTGGRTPCAVSATVACAFGFSLRFATAEGGGARDRTARGRRLPHSPQLPLAMPSPLSHLLRMLLLQEP